MKIRLRKVPANTLKRGDEFMGRFCDGTDRGHSDYIILRVRNDQYVHMYDGRTREFIGTSRWNKTYKVWKIVGRTRGKVFK